MSRSKAAVLTHGSSRAVVHRQVERSWLGLADELGDAIHLSAPVRSIAQHDDQVSFMAVDHRFDSLRDDPRFSAALRRLGLPVLAKETG